MVKRKENFNELAKLVVSLVTSDMDFTETLTKAFGESGLDLKILQLATGDVFVPNKRPSFPAIAPMLWKDRKDITLNPVQFICEVYGRFLDAKIMARSDLLELDRQLYNAYAQWIGRHPEDALAFSPVRERGRSPIADPVEAIGQVRATWRAARERHRAKHSSTITDHMP